MLADYVPRQAVQRNVAGLSADETGNDAGVPRHDVAGRPRKTTAAPPIAVTL